MYSFTNQSDHCAELKISESDEDLKPRMFREFKVVIF